MNKFDSIRPYKDNEVKPVLTSLCNNPDIIKVVLASKNYPLLAHLPFRNRLISYLLKNRIKDVNSIKEYQDIFEGIVSKVIKNSIKDFTVSGIENLDKDKSYLFISNHRDITLDSALLNLTLHRNNLKTTNNAVGNNLMEEKWASDLMRLNKSFIIDRSDKSKKDIYKSLHLASEFIFDSIVNKNDSVWIAQKQGRSKDGLDYTDSSVLKMIHLNARKSKKVHDYFNQLSVVPISISYERDPNDLLKTKELYLTSVNNKYEKEPKEDLQSISDGITGYKGNVHLSIGSQMTFADDDYDQVASQITSSIKSLYKIHSTNIASCIIQGIPVENTNFNNNQIEDAKAYLQERMHNIQDDMHPFFLSQYSNSVYKL